MSMNWQKKQLTYVYYITSTEYKKSIMGSAWGIWCLFFRIKFIEPRQSTYEIKISLFNFLETLNNKYVGIFWAKREIMINAPN